MYREFTFWHWSHQNLSCTTALHLLPVGLVRPVKFLTSWAECFAECCLYTIQVACSPKAGGWIQRPTFAVSHQIPVESKKKVKMATQVRSSRMYEFFATCSPHRLFTGWEYKFTFPRILGKSYAPLLGLLLIAILKIQMIYCSPRTISCFVFFLIFALLFALPSFFIFFLLRTLFALHSAFFS
jgi:hypothetical protein